VVPQPRGCCDEETVRVPRRSARKHSRPPVTCSNSVELRGFQPLTYSMRTSRVGLTWTFVAASSDVVRHRRRSAGLVMTVGGSRLKPGEDFLRDSCAIAGRVDPASKHFADLGPRAKSGVSGPVSAVVSPASAGSAGRRGGHSAPAETTARRPADGRAPRRSASLASRPASARNPNASAEFS